jgi:ABC-type Zn2+ transport system substrate-binding protein/surface adhesin
VAQLRRTAIGQGARCLFREAGDSEALARTLSEGTSMRVVELDLLAIRADESTREFAEFLLSVAGRVADCLRAEPMEPN